MSFNLSYVCALTSKSHQWSCAVDFQSWFIPSACSAQLVFCPPHRYSVQHSAHSVTNFGIQNSLYCFFSFFLGALTQGVPPRPGPLHSQKVWELLHYCPHPLNQVTRPESSLTGVIILDNLLYNINSWIVGVHGVSLNDSFLLWVRHANLASRDSITIAFTSLFSASIFLVLVWHRVVEAKAVQGHHSCSVL